jgi:hypothetical protein
MVKGNRCRVAGSQFLAVLCNMDGKEKYRQVIDLTVFSWLRGPQPMSLRPSFQLLRDFQSHPGCRLSQPRAVLLANINKTCSPERQPTRSEHRKPGRRRNVTEAPIAVMHGPCGEQPKAEVDLSTGIDAGTSTRTELAIVK